MTINLVMSNCPSACMEELFYPLFRFSRILTFTVFQKYIKKIQLSLKHYKNSRYFTRRPTCIYILPTSSENEKCFTQMCREKTHILHFIIFYENQELLNKIMWKNVVEPYRPQMTIKHMFLACWTTNATKHTVRIRNKLKLKMRTNKFKSYPKLSYVHFI
jgi:hypothetical protein